MPDGWLILSAEKGDPFITRGQDKKGLQNSPDAKSALLHSAEERTEARDIKSEAPKVKVMAMVIPVINAS